MKTNRTYIALGVLLIAGAVFFLYTSQPSAPAQTAQQGAAQTGNVSLTVQGLYAGRQVAITANETVLQVLQTLNAQDPQLQLATKEYAGMGTLVTGMHGNINGANQNYWQYNVNGVMPQIGAGGYTLKNGDAVDWFFGPSQQ